MDWLLKGVGKLLVVVVLILAAVVLVRVFALGETFDVSLITDSTTLSIAGFLCLGYLLYVLLNLDKKKKKDDSKGKNPGKIKTTSGAVVEQFSNMRWVTEDELLKESKFGFHYYSDLYKAREDGVLIRSELKGNRLLTNMYKPIHTLILGTTGSGKTEGFVIPSINVLSSTASKPSLVITDPKGELYKKTGRKLLSSGYQIKMLDLREPQKSTCWNPMDDAFTLFHRAHNIESEVQVFNGINPADTQFKHIAGEYNNEWYGFNGIAYPNKEMLDNDLLGEQKILISKADDILHDIAMALCPVVNEKDPTWERGAQDLIWGVMTAMLEDSLLEGTTMTRERFNLYNVNQICSYVDIGDDPYSTLKQYLLDRDKSSPVIGRVTTSVNNAPGTTKSYMGIVLTSLSLFSDSGIAFATSVNEMNFDTFTDTPTALIIRVPDDVVTRHPIATMMISRVYKTLVERAEKNKDSKLDRNVYFILDEFANLPKINDFANIITVSRGRGIFFEMVVQSYSQLNTKYGDTVAKTIRENCNIQIYIGSDDMTTKEEFSKLCGNMSGEKENVSESKDKKGEGGGKSVSKEAVQRPLIYPDELSVLPSETAIVKIFKEYPMKVKFNHSYKYPMFTRVPPDEKYVPLKRLDEAETRYDIGEVINKRRKRSFF